MSLTRWVVLPVVVAGTLMVSGAEPPAPPILESFTYQGLLTDIEGQIDGECDLRFSLWDLDMDGNQIGRTLLFDCWIIQNGLVDVELNFDPGAFNGEERWLQIDVRCPCASGEFDELMPRQLLTAAPYAIHALDSGRLGGVLPEGYLRNDPGVIDENLISDGAVSRNKIQGGAVGSAEIRADAIDGSKIADGSIGRADLGRGSVGNIQLQMSSVDGSKIIAGSITRSHLSANSVGTNEIQNDNVFAPDLASDLNSLIKVSGDVMFIDTGGSNGVKVNTTLEAGLLGGGTGTVIRAIGDVFATDDITCLDLLSAERARIGAFGAPDGKLEIVKSAAETVDIFNLVDGTTNVFTVIDGGNVGIGDSSPNATLHINTGSTGEDGFRVQINGSTKLIVNNNGSVSIGTTADGPDDGLYVQGAVGIGVSAPLTTLDVNGETLIRTSLLVGSPTSGFGYIDVKESVRIGGVPFGSGGTNGSLTIRNSVTSRKIFAYVNAVGSGEIITYGPNGYPNGRITNSAADSNYGWMGVYDNDGTGGVNGDGSQAGMHVSNILGRDTGVSWADLKLFRMRNPAEEGTEIWYVSLEGPEAGCYVRGTAQLVLGEGMILFPDHFKVVATSVGMTVSVTPLSETSKGLAVVSKSVDEGVMVKELGGGMGTYEFDFVVMAVRKGYENLEVIQDSSTLGPPVQDTLGEGEAEAGQ